MIQNINDIFHMSGCPPGLQYLTMVDQLLIKQKVEILEAVTGFETANKYEVLNSMGQNVGKPSSYQHNYLVNLQVYKAKEDSDCCTRNCCGPGR